MLLSQKSEGYTNNQNRPHVRRMLYFCFGALCGLYLFGGGGTVSAQTPPQGTAHSVTLGWTAPSPVGGSGTVAGYNLYKSIASAAYSKVNATPIAVLNYTDTSVSAGQALSYCASTIDSKGQESACSIAVTATVPTNPNPPTLTITSVAMNITGNTETVLAKWTNTNSVGQHFTFSDGHNFISQGLIGPTSGTFAQQVVVPAGTNVIFSVDDATGAFASQKVI